MLSGRDTQWWWAHLHPTCCNLAHLNFLHSEVVGTLKCVLRALNGWMLHVNSFTDVICSNKRKIGNHDLNKNGNTGFPHVSHSRGWIAITVDRIKVEHLLVEILNFHSVKFNNATDCKSCVSTLGISF